MAKIYQVEKTYEGAPDVGFFCPGCKCNHEIWTTSRNYNNATWGYNGNVAKPTFTPSIKITIGHHPKPDDVCHSFVNDGMIQFLSDCTHELKNQTVELPEINK